MEQLNQLIETYGTHPGVRFLTILFATFVLALFLKYFINGLLKLLTRKTATDLDDRIFQILGGPVFLSVLFSGLGYALLDLDPGQHELFVAMGVLKTLAVLIWGIAIMRLAQLLLSILSNVSDRATFIQPSTLPLFQILVKTIVVGGIAYFALVAWNIDVTGWLASAGIVGIAVGFAAKDTLANLFAGLFIVTDRPYKIGDFIILEKGNERGKVTQIGLRSTRILTRDDIEVTIPNAVIGNSKIINETGGRFEKMRLRIPVPVAYGSDPDKVKRILLVCAQDIEHISPEPEPSVRFVSFGDSALDFQLRVWIEQPVFKGRVIDILLTKIYTELNKADIEIPYSKQDVYIKQFPFS